MKDRWDTGSRECDMLNVNRLHLLLRVVETGSVTAAAEELLYSPSAVSQQLRVRSQPGARAVQVFDQKTAHLLEPRYSTGTPVTAQSLEELAVRLGIPPRTLEETVLAFNAACPDGDFDPFRKDGMRAEPEGQPRKSNWAQPLEEPAAAHARGGR